MPKLGWFKPPIKKVPAVRQPDGLSDIPHLLLIQTAAELLTPHYSFLVQIEELAGLAKDPLECFYLAAIRRFARFVQQLPASEVHHHAGPGGMLTHTLEVSVIALKVRRSYLLSETGGAEEIAAKQDLWTYAVFLAALCHDLAKVAVDQTVTIFDRNRQQQTWDPWNQFMDEQGIGYIAEFVPNRRYRLHEKATPLLTNKIIPPQGMRWLTSDRNIFVRWLACVSGDLENAGSLGQIVNIADSQSVAANLGADDDGRMPAVKTIPLHEKMLTALRYLLTEGALPLNRNGAAGWVQGEYCWLVSKRTVDAVREHLIREGHSGIPTKNSRLFDLWQEYAVLIPYGDKAIWTARISGEGWCNELTLIKIPLAKIWTNPARRPEAFDGRINVIQGKQSADYTNDASSNDSQTDSALDCSSEIIDSDSAEFDSVKVIIRNSNDENNRYPEAQRDIKPDEDSNSVDPSVKEATDPVGDFFTWLQNGIRQGIIKTNQPTQSPGACSQRRGCLDDARHFPGFCIVSRWRYFKLAGYPEESFEKELACQRRAGTECGEISSQRRQ